MAILNDDARYLFELDMDTGERRVPKTDGSALAGLILRYQKANTQDHRTRRCRSAGIAGLSSEVFS